MMRSVLREVGEVPGILLTILSIMGVVTVATGLVMVALELATWIGGSVSVWWAKLLGFSVVLILVFSLAAGSGGYLWKLVE